MKKNAEASFASDGAEMLRIRNKNMAESALKAASESNSDLICNDFTADNMGVCCVLKF